MTSKSEQIRHAIEAAIRAVGRQPMGEPMVNLGVLYNKNYNAEQAQSLARGKADSAALLWRAHDAKLHAQLQPAEHLAQTAFLALEEVRLDWLAAQALPGVVRNIGALLADEAGKRNLAAVEPGSITYLPFALRLWGYDTLASSQHQRIDEINPSSQRKLGSSITEKLANQEVSLDPSLRWDDAEKLLPKIWQQWLDERLEKYLADLQAQANNQHAFAKTAYQILQQLDLVREAPPEIDLPAAPVEEKQPPAEQLEGDADSSGAGASQAEWDENFNDVGEDLMPAEDGPAVETGFNQGGAGSEEAPPQQQKNNGVEDFKPVKEGDYKVFTTSFDEIIQSKDLAGLTERQALRAQLDAAMAGYLPLIAKLANRLQRRLLAQQQRSWRFDQEEGYLDAARLARIVVQPHAPLAFKQEKKAPFKDTIVTLLLDNSGSMRGRPIMMAALCAEILARTLERCGVKSEILGYTTVGWKGGPVRDAWLNANQPKSPGRLNALRHIIYKQASEPMRRARLNIPVMLKEGLLKENIDGEALKWAMDRLSARNEVRKILLIISDGAPVDDATLGQAPALYLEKHLREVIKEAETHPEIELAAIGIGHDVRKYYPHAVTIHDIQQLGATLLGQLQSLFAAAN